MARHIPIPSPGLLLPTFLGWLCAGSLTCAGAPSLRIGLLSSSPNPQGPHPHATAAWAFAQQAGITTRLVPASTGGWQDDSGTLHALEESDVIWFHDGDGAERGRSFPETAREDLRAYLDLGGAVLLSGAAGRLLNEIGLEPTPLRVLGVSGSAIPSGIRVVSQHREHPAFSGLDISKVILLTSRGCNALADFYGTAGPTGELLANGNGAGERPVVEYRSGTGCAIFVGWRLADFTTAGDEHRPQLERLFTNLLQYLAAQNRNRAFFVRPPGPVHYERRFGVPFLLGLQPVNLTCSPAGGLRTGACALGNGEVTESPLDGKDFAAQVLGLTLTQREQPVARFRERLQAEQDASDREDRERIGHLQVLTPTVKTLPAPLAPQQPVQPNQSVLLGRSPYMAPGDGEGDISGPPYEPLEDGGFRVVNSPRRLNRPIVHGQNRIWTGDVPLFRMDTVTGNGSYARDERVFPLWPRPGAQIGNVNPCMGTLRLGIPQPDGKVTWLDEQPGIETRFRPGSTEYHGTGFRLTIAPALDFHGLICRIEFDRETPLCWQFGGIFWQSIDTNSNQITFDQGIAQITEANLPNGLVLAGWDGGGKPGLVASPMGQEAKFTAPVPRRVYHLAATWGVTTYEEERARQTMARLDTAISAAWPQEREALKQAWFNCYIGRALNPESNLRRLLAAPEAELQRTLAHWETRRKEFQVRTPDAHLNALLNWARAVSEYHRQGPGLVLGGQIWQMYSHISTGWYGKQWAGDHAAMAECLRLYGAMQGNDGFIRWISPSLVAFNAENNTPYWVDQVWRHYTWTGDRKFVQDLWPAVQKAVAWTQSRNDPDGDGLYRDGYEYWNCDSNGKGPKSAAPSAMAWAMWDRAARMAAVTGDSRAQVNYQAHAAQTRTAVFRELWNESEGRLGCIGSDGLWRGHPQTWEEYLAVNAGLLEPEQARRAMRWLASHYGFEPRPGVRLLASSDWWPIRWSCQWVPTGDTCLAALAGMKGGDADLWWPYLKTVVGSAFRSECPGINMGIANTGAGGGDREDVDSDDPHLHVAVRGLFGIEPALHEGRFEICPAFPSGWTEASIQTPDLSYEWRRQGNLATFRIRTPKPLVKRVRAGLGGEERTTPAETESELTLRCGPPAPPVTAPKQPSILSNCQPTPSPVPLSAAERNRLLLFDLAAAYNQTSEEFVATRFTFDHGDAPSPLKSWWGNPELKLPPSPRVLASPQGVLFLTAGRPRSGSGPPPKNLLALASWQPHPLPGGTVIPVGARCERLWLLLQSYVHPMKNYLPNGEVILRYASGESSLTSLVPPFNLDCYFQHFSREGVAMPYGQLGAFPPGWTPIHLGMASAHADALEIRCAPERVLESIELRATCSEAVLGLAGLTALEALAHPSK